MNFSDKAAEVALDGRSYVDLETNEIVETIVPLPVDGIRVLKRDAVPHRS
jgi:beta-galactosidase